MAFVFRAEKSETVIKQDPPPGPGQYIEQSKYELVDNQIPFYTSASRDKLFTVQDSTPGPGTYNLDKNFLITQENLKSWFTPIHHKAKRSLQAKFPGISQPRARRFEIKVDENIPGPGAYDNYSTFKTRSPSQQTTVETDTLQLVQNIILNTHSSVPSIPTNAQSFGYSKTDDDNMVLNTNPFAEVPQFVGPGYYEVKDNSQGKKYTGPTWHKSGMKRIGSFAHQKSTPDLIGPGTYEIPEKSKIEPSYKNNINSGFASSGKRTLDQGVKPKLDFNKVKSTMLLSPSVQTVSKRRPSDLDEEEDDDEYLKEATPGPGYYYNESTASTFGKKSFSSNSSPNKRHRSQSNPKNKPDGSGISQKLNIQIVQSDEPGPGAYNIRTKLFKPKIGASAPFQSSNRKIEKFNPIMSPGPAAYSPTINIADKLKENAKRGPLGNFGTTEDRFKVSQLLQMKETPGPGRYLQENGKAVVEDITASIRKGSHFFRAEGRGTMFKANTDINASPGSYDLVYYDISKKIQREGERIELTKRYPFNSGQVRFEKPIAPTIPEDDEEDGPRFTNTKSLESLIKSKVKENPSAAFKSESIRTSLDPPRRKIPGPGTYHNKNLPEWNKKSYNVLFLGD